MAENTSKKVKIITAPDQVFDQSQTLLVISPKEDLKSSVHEYALNCEDHLSIYLYNGEENNIPWLLSVARSVDNVLLEMDNCTADVSHFFGYILSLPNTYYRCQTPMAPWDLLNKNRFYDFPKLNEE